MAKFKNIPELTEKDIERFWSNVEKTSNDKCWIWKGTTTLKNSRSIRYKVGTYGRFQLQGGKYLAHRISYFIHNNKDPKELLVCHSCPDGDDPRCISPYHLFLGTYEDNTRDSFDKGRRFTRILSNEIVNEIRDQFALGVKQVSLCKAYSLKKAAISSIVRGKSYKISLNNNYKHKIASEKDLPSCLTKEQINAIRYNFNKGIKQKDLVIEYNSSSSVISNIVNNKTWRHLLPENNILSTDTQNNEPVEYVESSLFEGIK